MRKVSCPLMLLLAAAAVSVLLYRGALSAADTDFPIYFENSTLAVKSQAIERATYLPLVEIVRHLGLAYTDATGLLTFTVQGQNSRLTLTPDSAFVSLNDTAILLQNPVRRINGQWLVPLDFLSQGLSRVAGLEFRYRPGDPRVFAGNLTPAELTMSVQAQGPNTRLTLRTGTSIEVELQRDAAQRSATLVLKGKPIDPTRESLDYKDRLLQSVIFDDADGTAKIRIAVTEEVREIRITSAEENRVYFADFIREAAPEAAPPPPPPTAGRPDANVATSGVRVIVIDAGHGGIDSGASNAGTLEKDLTLALARRLRTALQSRLGATVLLTRDSDVALTGEARSAVANNNQAGLLISLHVGYSPNEADSGSSIYVMQPDFTGSPDEAPQGARLFLPWRLAHRPHLQASEALALQLQQELNQSLPGWKFPLRSGPIAVLASAAMPAIAVEIGNLKNDVSAQTLVDPAFQAGLATTIATAIERFASSRPGVL